MTKTTSNAKSGKTLKIRKPVAAAKKAAAKKNVEANVEKTKKRLTEKKDLKYIYPTEINTLEARKKFRGGNRNKRDSFLKKIAKAENKSQEAKIRKEANAWAKTVFTKEAMPKF